MARKRDPRTKEELLDRMLSYDFDGDIRHLGVEPASIVRVGPNTLRLSFPDSGTVFELSVHRPREFSQAARASSGESRSFTRDPEASTEGLRATGEKPAPKRKYTRRQPAEQQRTGS